MSNPKFTRRDFQFIAETLKQIREDGHTDLAIPLHNRIAKEFANRCAATNPNFNRDRFLAACGVAEDDLS